MAAVGLIDVGLGNLMSVRNALEHVGAQVTSAAAPTGLDGIDRVVLPGVGAFAEGMSRLADQGWPAWLHDHVASGGTVLGICLGMQLLADTGSEGGPTSGLGLIPGRVEALRPDTPTARVPHIGWNEVEVLVDHPILGPTGQVDCFYFVHSFRFVPDTPAHAAAVTDHGGDFVSAVASGRVIGVQFHPEKSHRAGLELLARFTTADTDSIATSPC